MLLMENVGKRLLAQWGFNVPRGIVVEDPKELAAALSQFEGPMVLKAQIEAGGRGKSGGIKFAENIEEATSAFHALLGTTVGSHLVRSILVEQRLEIVQERYLGLFVDGAGISLLIGRDGGMDIEETSLRDPASVLRVPIDEVAGPIRSEVVFACERFGIPHVEAYAEMAVRLFQLFRKHDALVAEINPIAELRDGTIAALDARISIDDNALYRQPEFKRAKSEPETRRGPLLDHEIHGLKLLRNNGTIGYVGIGGGLGLTVIDWIAGLEENVAAVIDLDDIISEGRLAVDMTRLIEYFDRDPNIRTILVNIITCGYDLKDICQKMFDALDLRTSTNPKPIVFNLHGNGEKAAHALLRVRCIHNCSDLSEAIARSISAARDELPL